MVKEGIEEEEGKGEFWNRKGQRKVNKSPNIYIHILNIQMRSNNEILDQKNTVYSVIKYHNFRD